MQSKLDRYMLRNNLGLLVALIALALALLMLERLIRITDLVAGSNNALETGGQMVANLLPHYLGMALPSALLIAIIATTERLSRSGEIVALMSTGVPLARITRPYLILSLVLAIASIINSGFLQPLARYNYREIVHELRQSSIVSAFQERKFVQFERKVVWTDSVDFSGRDLGETFIIETGEDGSRQFITGQAGILAENDDRNWEIQLEGAMIGQLPAQIENSQGNRLNTDKVTWKLPKPDFTYRERGDDQRELTLPELLQQSRAGPNQIVHPVTAITAMHERLARATLLMTLPLIGVVLGLQLGRMGRSGGLALGILLMLFVQKLLEYGLDQAHRGVIPPWAGSWPVVILLFVLGLYTFRRRAKGLPALPSLWASKPRPVQASGAKTGG